MNVSIWHIRIQGRPDTGVSICRENSTWVKDSKVWVGNYKIISTARVYRGRQGEVGDRISALGRDCLMNNILCK